MQLSQQELGIIRNYFSDKPVLRAYLFGSFSRDEARADSDIDILVELDYSRHIGLAFVDMKMELEKKLEKKIDLVSTLGLSKLIIPFVNKDKKLIYKRKNQR